MDSRKNTDTDKVDETNQETNKKFFLTKSFCPKKLPTPEEDEKEYGESYSQRVRNGDIRTDVQNLRFDSESQMYFFPPVDAHQPTNVADTHSDEERFRLTNRCTLF